MARAGRVDLLSLKHSQRHVLVQSAAARICICVFERLQILRRLLAPQNNNFHEFFRSHSSPESADLKVGATFGQHHERTNDEVFAGPMG